MGIPLHAHLVTTPDPIHYQESEVIWQAVSESTWVELKPMSRRSLRSRRRRRGSELSCNWSYNLFSADIIRWTGLLIHKNRERFIGRFNSIMAEWCTPLRRSDDLAACIAPIGGLRSWAEEREAWFKQSGSIFKKFLR
ncbi:BQ2448_5379 [Microbotryum intermedium]|uniref:BQ2448_5379 protein n=1 Tax=Microbotryum intermedium TaxID=269621 RepID=A0A238F9B1_9BASI|nr:BQ2448_5379 [Microbotryum intermedium]